MGELANYSIETDQTVLLLFKDGRRLRVAMGHLPYHLTAPDLELVRRAVKLRHDFIRRHMPKLAAITLTAGLLALFLAGGRVVARLWQQPEPTDTAPDRPAIVRSLTAPSPAATPTPQPAVLGSTVAPPARPTVRLVRQRSSLRRPILTTPASSNQPSSSMPELIPPVPLPQQQPNQSVPDQPIADATQPPPDNQPLPTPTPAPDTPPPGQVLGESTGPDDAAASTDGTAPVN